MSLCPRLARTLGRTRPSVLHPSIYRTLRAVPFSNPAPAQLRLLHSSPGLLSKPTNPDPRENPANELAPTADINVGQKRLADFDLKGRVFVVTGAARGLGLALAESLVEAGGKGDICPEAT